MPEEERDRRIYESDDLCAIDGDLFMIRGVLYLPIDGGEERFGWGIWVSVLEDDYYAYLDAWDNDTEDESPPFVGQIASAITPYPGAAGLDVLVKPQSGGDPARLHGDCGYSSVGCGPAPGDLGRAGARLPPTLSVAGTRAMFVVIFEVQPKAERWDDYLATARLLRPEIERIDGFLDNERYKSERTSGRVLSLSTWRDEKALVRWRTHATHHVQGQERGRFEIFEEYHLRVGEVTADSATPPETTLRGQRFDTTEIGQATVVTLTELGPETDDAAMPSLPPSHGAGLVDHEWFASLTTEGKRVLLAAWTDAEAANRYRPEVGQGVRHRQVRVIRDYGMRDRREAPQYFPDIG